MKRKNKNIVPKNYLNKIPLRSDNISWKSNSTGIVTLEIKNLGLVNKIAQLLFKKPKISYVHLDKMGSFIWSLMDGKTNITEIGKMVDAKFGEAAHPLYERLSKFFQIMDSYHLAKLVD